MHFLILTIEYPPVGGGASPMIHEINKQFIRHGHSVSVVTMAVDELPGHIQKEGIDIYHINCYRIHKHMSNVWEHISFLLAAKKFLRSFIPGQQIDFCFTHFLVPTGILARWVNKKYHIPYSITAHGSDIPGYNPDRFRFLHRFTPPLLRSIAASSQAIISPSRYLYALILNIGRIDEAKLEHIPNGIDPVYFQPGTKKPILLSTGRLVERKGFHFLIDAVSDESFPFEVHICGDGPMMKTLMEKAAGSKTPIIFHGWMDNKSEQYKSLLAEASIYSLVSAKENASISLLEALSSGCVVITSNVSGCPESVGSAGICIPPGDVNALREALRRLTAHPDVAMKLMQEGRQRAVTQFSWDTIAERYLELVPKRSQV